MPYNKTNKLLSPVVSNVGDVSRALSLWALLSLQGCVLPPPAFYLPTQSKKEIQSSLCKTLLSPRNSTESERCPCSVYFPYFPTFLMRIWLTAQDSCLNVVLFLSFKCNLRQHKHSPTDAQSIKINK